MQSLTVNFMCRTSFLLLIMTVLEVVGRSKAITHPPVRIPEFHFVGAGALTFYPIHSGAAGAMKIAIAAAVIVTALGIFFQKPLHSLGRRLRTTDAEHFKALQERSRWRAARCWG